MDEFKTHPSPPPPPLLPLPPPPPGSFLSGAKGASPACRADWPARDDTKVPPPPNMASYLISTLAMGGRKVSSRRRRGKRAERTLLRLPKVYSINPGSRNFLRIGLWLVWGGGGRLRGLARRICSSRRFYCSVDPCV